MFNKPKPAATLDEAIERILLDMKGLETTSPEYAKLIKRLTSLTEIKAKKPRRLPSNDTLATVGANLGGILLILYFERGAILTSRAISLVKKAM